MLCYVWEQGQCIRISKAGRYFVRNSVVRALCTSNSTFVRKTQAESNQDARNALPFNQIPGPNPLPLVGNLFFFSKYGQFPLETYWRTVGKLHCEYGNIVRISKVAPKTDILYLFRPEDLQKLFQEEGPLPYRPKLEILSYYREKKSNFYTSGGLVTENGESWKHLRKSITPLLDRKVVAAYQEHQADVAESLVDLIDKEQNGKPCVESTHRIEVNNNQSHIDDLLPLLYRYTLEAVGMVSLGKSLGCLRKTNCPGNKTDDSQADKILRYNEDTLEAIFNSLYIPPLYKLFPDKNFTKLSEAQSYIEGMLEEELKHLREEFQKTPSSFIAKNPVVASLFQNKDLDPKDTQLLLMEILEGGIDATATTLGFCLHFLASEPSIQGLLHEEVANIDPRIHNLQGLPLLKAVLKETFRLRPSAAAVGRVLQRDSVFRGYHVPAGTIIQGPSLIASRDPKSFPNPDKFDPIRWIRNEDLKAKYGSNVPDVSDATTEDGSRTKVHPYALLPFGHGARMCPGRRLAEQEIYLALIKIIQNYKLERSLDHHGWNAKANYSQGCYSDQYLGQVMRLNMMPADKISIKFIKRQ